MKEFRQTPSTELFIERDASFTEPPLIHLSKSLVD
jgi:hypothetical protein